MKQVRNIFKRKSLFRNTALGGSDIRTIKHSQTRSNTGYLYKAKWLHSALGKKMEQ